MTSLSLKSILRTADLEAQQLAAVQVVQRRVGQCQRAVGQGLAQVGLQPHPVGHLGVQLDVEHGMTRLAVHLGPVHRDVGVAQHVLGP